MDHLLFLAAFGYRMKTGMPLADALLETALAHEDDAKEWAESKEAIWDRVKVGDWERRPMTLREHFEAKEQAHLAFGGIDIMNDPRLALATVEIHEAPGGSNSYRFAFKDKLAGLHALAEHMGLNVKPSRWQRFKGWFNL